MGKLRGFLEFDREVEKKLSVEQRLQNYKEFVVPHTHETSAEQAARCMNCGIPFCHSGCPLGNIIPDFNDLVYRGLWHEALDRLHSTNNFPEFTGRICPAPCEEACVLGITNPPVTIETIEKNLIEFGFEKGWVQPQLPSQSTGFSVAVVGAGPSGLAAAQQLSRAGHCVTVFERADRVGGLLRYGIPDFKLEKSIIDRRVKIMEEEGILFKTNTEIGVNYSAKKLKEEFNAVVLCCGSTSPRDLPVKGRDLEGVEFAMDFLKQSNQSVAGDQVKNQLKATDKNVIVIGGGDTGSDCIGTSNRQKAKSVANFELFPKSTTERPKGQPWPFWPMRLKTTSSHEEGCDRNWSIMTKEFCGKNGKLTSLKTVNVKFEKGKLLEIEGSEKEWPCELVLLALGFVGPEQHSVIKELGIDLDERGNVKADENHMTNVEGVFSAGDMRRGQSLVVWAISEGRTAAHYADKFLMGESYLPLKGEGDLPRV